MTEEEIQAVLNKWIDDEIMLDIVEGLCKSFGTKPPFLDHHEKGRSFPAKRINWQPRCP